MKIIPILIVAYLLQIIAGISAMTPTFLAVYITEPYVPKFIVWIGIITHWIIGPVFAGYVAVTATMKIFKETDITKIATPYISSLITILALWLTFVTFNSHLFKWSVLVPSSLVIIGAYIAQRIGHRRQIEIMES